MRKFYPNNSKKNKSNMMKYRITKNHKKNKKSQNKNHRKKKKGQTKNYRKKKNRNWEIKKQ